MVGLESRWALTSEAMMLTLGVVDEASTGILGLEGRRPLRPLRLSVRTTKRGQGEEHVYDSYMTLSAFEKQKLYQLMFPFFFNCQCKALVTYVSELPGFAAAKLSLRTPICGCHALATASFERVSHCITFFDHSHCKTFLETTELASVSPPLVYWTVFIGKAHILCIFLDSSLSNTQRKHINMES